MKSRNGKRLRGFTLIELLVVIGIIMILITGIIKVAQSVQVKAKIKNTKSTISLLCAVLEEYRDVRSGSSGLSFPVDPLTWITKLKVPPDPANDGASVETFNATLGYNGLGGLGGSFVFDKNDPMSDGHLVFTWDDLDLLPPGQEEIRRGARASIEMLYLYLESVSECRAMLNRLGSDATSNDDNDWVVEGAAIQRPLIEVNDAWGHPLRYQWQGEGNFPLISSAGEDGVFDTADDIISSEL